MSNTKKVYSELMRRFADDAAKIIKETAENIECEILPYVESDTELNISLRVNEALDSLIQGNVETDVSSGFLLIKSREFGASIKIDSSKWNSAARVIIDNYYEGIKDIRIKQLEEEVADLKRTLTEGW